MSRWHRSGPGSYVKTLEGDLVRHIAARPFVLFAVKSGVGGRYIHVQQVEHGTDELRDFLGRFQRRPVADWDVRVWRLVAIMVDDHVAVGSSNSVTLISIDGDVLMRVEELLHDDSFRGTYRVIDALADGEQRLAQYLARLVQ